jgi:hypothetical protein
MGGMEEMLAFFRHDDDLRRRIDDLTHYVALDGCRFGKYRMECRHDRHFEARQELDNITPGLTAENAVFVLKAHDVETRIVQKLGSLNILSNRFVVDLEAHSWRVVIGATGVRHGDDAGLQIRASGRDRPMKIVRKGSDSATARKVIPDERNTMERAH